MAILTSELNLLAFPQSWNGGALTIRFLCLPQNDPTEPLQAGLPSFADADLRFEARLIGSLDRLPRAADAVATPALDLSEPPTQKAALFAALKQQIAIAPGDPIPPGTPSFRKPVAASYRALVGDRELSPGLADADTYECALHEAHSDQPADPVPLRGTLDWGEVLAFALRQPKLAAALGLIGEAVIPADPAVFARGGWLYLALNAASDAAGVPVASFAARIPPLLDTPRDVYATVLFPLDDLGAADVSFHEAEIYDRGFARLVHATAGDTDDDGIRLAWDDEHIADMFARQVYAKSTRPMGTGGFRVDVQDANGDGSWHSLQQVASIDDLKLGDVVIGPYAGELAVEVVPVQPSPARPGDFWMPPYFCTWRGASLVLTDPDLTNLHRRADVEPEVAAMRLGRQTIFAPVGDKDVPLLYGHDYRFRVRLADLSRGGPPVDAALPEDADDTAHYSAAVAFRRHRRPGPIEVVQRPTRDALQIVIAKPRLRHPELLFTGRHDFADVEAGVDDDLAEGRQREAGLPDPDVVQVAIRLEVRALRGDAPEWQSLYVTTRAFDEARIAIDLAPVDIATLADLVEDQPGEGAIQIPAAREVRLVLAAIGDDKPDYFASDQARIGPEVSIEMRAAATAEPAPLSREPGLQSFFFRPGGNDKVVPRPLVRLAHEAGLDAHDLTLAGRPGGRTIFGCANALRHVLSPERSALTFASDADLSQRWINVVTFDLARDWTWNGLAADGLIVRRRTTSGDADDPAAGGPSEIAGTIDLPRSLSTAILAGIGPGARDAARAMSRIVFVDAVDPKPAPGKFPDELTITYEIEAVLRDGVAAPGALSAAVLLPVTTPPVQVPRLVSAGIALSPHIPTADYASTNQRDRQLWMEFERLPADTRDAYFVRILATGPDPLLTEEHAASELVPEPILAIDDEPMRLISPGQPRDRNGLAAMEPLHRRSADGASFLIPLPDGLDPAANELFGMFTYEIRVGHDGERWSTAQGRFGPALRVAGVQHPPPPLVCLPSREAAAIRVRAPFATPVLGGRHVRPPLPKTRLWSLLYARVRQTDAAGWRNLMLLRAQLFPKIEHPEQAPRLAAAPPRLIGESSFTLADVEGELARRGLPADAPLTALVAEFHTDPAIDDPLGGGLAQARMLRVSPLVAVPDAC